MHVYVCRMVIDSRPVFQPEPPGAEATRPRLPAAHQRKALDRRKKSKKRKKKQRAKKQEREGERLSCGVVVKEKSAGCGSTTRKTTSSFFFFFPVAVCLFFFLHLLSVCLCPFDVPVLAAAGLVYSRLASDALLDGVSPPDLTLGLFCCCLQQPTDCVTPSRPSGAANIPFQCRTRHVAQWVR